MKNPKKLSFIVILFFFIFSNNAFAIKVVLDPGHGGADPGAIGVNGLQEKTVNLDVTLRLQDELVKRGYTVSLTREIDRAMSLQERVDFKEHQDADLFVSIHANAYHNAIAQGSLVLYYDHRYPLAAYPASPAMAALSATNKQFAQTVLDGLLAEAQTQDKGIVPSSVYVVRYGSMPSILVELAFLTNWEDATRLANENDREKMAQGIANGIESFWPLGLFRDIAGHWASQAIQRLNELGIVVGSNSKYLPENALTRAEFLTVMDRVFDFSKELSKEDENEYDEIEEDETEYDEIEEDENVTGGNGEDETDENGNGGNGEEDTVEEKRVDEVTMAASSYDAEQDVADFYDVEQSHWAYSVLERATQHGIIQGYPDGSLRPDQAISRAEVSVLFDRIWEEDIHVAIQPFDDVPSDLWFAPSVYRLKSADLIQGVSATSFAPFRFMTRAEMAVVIDRFLNTAS